MRAGTCVAAERRLFPVSLRFPLSLFPQFPARLFSLIPAERMTDQPLLDKSSTAEFRHIAHAHETI